MAAMKRLILSVIAIAFAVAVHAGDSQSCQDKEKAGCCANKVKVSLDSKASKDTAKDESPCCASKVKTSVQASGGCPFAAAACSMQAPAKPTAAKPTVLSSPKAASYASK
jgi:hypothetical protein